MTAERKSVLILAPADDLHALAVRRQIERRGTARCAILDLRNPPSLSLKSGGACDTNTASATLSVEGSELSADEVLSVWMRRPGTWDASGVVDPEFVEFAERNTRALADGFLRFARQRGVRFVNDPDRESISMDKLYQLHVATDCGMRVPTTLATSSPLAARHFIEELWHRGLDVIQKPARSARNQSYTHRLVADDLQELHRLSVAPMQFQEFVRGTDLRVTVVGAKVFAAQVVPTGAGSDVDWRRDACPAISETRLTDADESRVLAFMRQLGLTYGAVDFKRLADGSLVFLEVNPSGQFLFVEIDANLDISGEMATTLSASAPGM